jgi:hypothetical protein
MYVQLADFLDVKSTLDANSRVVLERVGGASQLTAGGVIVYKNMSGQERGDPRIIPPLRKWPSVWRACNLTAFINSFIGSVVYPFASLS